MSCISLWHPSKTVLFFDLLKIFGSYAYDQDCEVKRQGKKILPSVSTSLALATGIGVVEAVVLSVGSSFLMNIMGIPLVRQTNLIATVDGPSFTLSQKPDIYIVFFVWVF